MKMKRNFAKLVIPALTAILLAVFVSCPAQPDDPPPPTGSFYVIGNFYGLSGGVGGHSGLGYWHSGWWGVFGYLPDRPSVSFMGQSGFSGIGRQDQIWNLSGFDYITFSVRANFTSGTPSGADSAEGERYRFFLETSSNEADRFFVNNSDIVITGGFDRRWVEINIPLNAFRNDADASLDLANVSGWRIHKETQVRDSSVIWISDIVARRADVSMPPPGPTDPPSAPPATPPPAWAGGAPSWTAWADGHVKRGVSYNFNTPSTGVATEADMDLLAPGVKWFYNWSPNIPTHVRSAALERGLVFIPQIWGAAWNYDSVLANLRGLIAEGHDIRWLMAYNEPMLSDQANLTPAQAAADWPRIVQLARELDLKLISPAMNFGTVPPPFDDPLVWFATFLEQPGVYLEDMHAIRIHTYMSHLSALKWYVELFKRWGLPIWVTEFCAWYYATSEQFQMDYMSEAVVYLELNPWVEKYFWFIPKGGWAGNLNQSHPYHHLLTITNPPQLTALGQVYVNMPHFDWSVWVPTGQRMIARNMTNANTSTAVFTPAGSGSPSVRFRPSTDTATDRAPIDIHNFTGNRWIEFQVEVPAGGASTLSIRNVAPSAATMHVYVNGVSRPNISLSQTTTWRTTQVPFALSAGRHTIRLRVSGGNCAINWLRLDS